MSAENRGPKLAVKCETVRGEDDTLTPMASLRDIPGSSGIRTVLGNEVRSDSDPRLRMIHKPDTGLGKCLKTDVGMKDLSIVKLARDI